LGRSLALAPKAGSAPLDLALNGRDWELAFGGLEAVEIA
jgi:hypothetical protein